jgi:hypothetical protein
VRAFLFPHRLVAPKPVYLAALHSEEAVAFAAFESWAKGLDVEQITYPAHKLIGLIAARFGGHLGRFQHGGVLQNIARQGRLRAHAQLAVLRGLLGTDAVGGIGLVAIGGLRERLVAVPEIAGDVDNLELCLPLAKWDQGLAALAAAGWQAKVQRPRARNALVGQLHHPSAAMPIRLTGLPIADGDLRPLSDHAGLSIMSDGAHVAFLRSRSASLLLRRDQGLFDVFTARMSGGIPGIVTGDLPWLFRRTARQVLGD